MTNTSDFSEADTRAELIDKQLAAAGWETGDDVRVQREFPISQGKIIGENKRGSKLSADYVLFYKNVKLGIIEAKKSSLSYTNGVAQAKKYADLLNVRFTYATNGTEVYQIDMETGTEKLVDRYPSPQELWHMTYASNNQLFNVLSAIPMYTDGQFHARYYQENAVNAVIRALADGHQRILLTLATGTGKTCIAFQIVWKLMTAKWNIMQVGSRHPRVLFLADRNILADQAFNAFEAFPQESMARINPKSIGEKKGTLPTAQHIFFTIFQTFMAGKDNTPYFGQYPKDFFDFIIIDECHRGGANAESNWRGILEYFSPAVQLGMTATPKRKDNVDTYKYFGDPVYTYSLKQAINDGFLTPFRVRHITTNFGTYQYQVGDDIRGTLDTERNYTEPDFNRKIELKEKEEARVKDFMGEINQNEKTLVFCATQYHAGVIRDLINQVKTASNNVNYCVRVTAEDGQDGETFLRQFQDTEKNIPTILTTSEKLSTGVDAIQIRNIVLLRPITSMIEFKQIIGRGTRLCEGKAYFTVYDYVNASKNFEDPEWDGPVEYTGKRKSVSRPLPKPVGPASPPIMITLGPGRSVQITHKETTFYDQETGKMITAEEFMKRLTGKLPAFFKNEEELRQIWSDPVTRKGLLKGFAKQGYNIQAFAEIQKILNAQDKDVFDVLQYIAYNTDMKTRQERMDHCMKYVADTYKARQVAFIEFVLQQYVKNGVVELNDDRLGELIKLKYGTALDAKEKLGEMKDIRALFCGFQHFLYQHTLPQEG